MALRNCEEQSLPFLQGRRHCSNNLFITLQFYSYAVGKLMVSAADQLYMSQMPRHSQGPLRYKDVSILFSSLCGSQALWFWARQLNSQSFSLQHWERTAISTCRVKWDKVPPTWDTGFVQYGGLKINCVSNLFCVRSSSGFCQNSSHSKDSYSFQKREKILFQSVPWPLFFSEAEVYTFTTGYGSSTFYR